MTEYPVKSPRKLIEVALPLDAINNAAAREKTIRHGHPSSLHLWWARRPLAAARAVIFAQLVNDPGYQQGNGFKYGVEKKKAAVERKRLFKIIEDLVLWENSSNEEVLETARIEIRRSWRDVCRLNKDHPDATLLFNPEKLPAFHDPFAGGGAIPFEAQRLGLESYASDLNPVAVLIEKSMIEFPAKFAGNSPVSSMTKQKRAKSPAKLGQTWSGAMGLAKDVQYYGNLVRELALKRIEHLYPKVEVTEKMAIEREDLAPLVGKKLTVIAYLWARTVKSPDPVFSDVAVPLVTSFILAKRAGKEAYVQPIVSDGSYRFTVNVGVPPADLANGTSAGKRQAFRCLLSGAPMDYGYIRREGQAGRIGERLMAIVAEGPRGRVYLSPTVEIESAAAAAVPMWRPEVNLPDNPRDFKTPNYGLRTYADLFTRRQLVALTTFSDLISEVRSVIFQDALANGMASAGAGIAEGGGGAKAYSEAVSVYLAFALDKLADLGNSLCGWEPIAQCPRHLFGKQAIPMIWDFAEANPFSDSSGSWEKIVDGISKALSKVFQNTQPWFFGEASQADAQTQTISRGKFISSDPPYYDNIGYADLSDFFYIWLRRALRPVYPSLFATMAVPKNEELVATPYRHGSKEGADAFFLDGMTSAMKGIASQSHPEAPITIYYAFKQSETTSNSGTVSTGWVSFLGAVLESGLQLTGTWPLRTENASRMIGQGTNALASSIVLVCRKRSVDALTTSRREFIRELNSVLPEALDEMTRGSGDDRSPIAPVDLSQAIIGPGMAVFSKFSAVLEADGSPMSVRTALELINRFLVEDDFDADTQFCLRWFEQLGWDEGSFGGADVLARSKSTSVERMKNAGVLHSGSGKVRLLKWSEYPTEWDVSGDHRTPIWEALHQLIRALKQGGEVAAGTLLAGIEGRSEAVRQLAYRLYTLCERLGQAEDARSYNELITSWPSIESAGAKKPTPTQRTLFND